MEAVRAMATTDRSTDLQMGEVASLLAQLRRRIDGLTCMASWSTERVHSPSHLAESALSRLGMGVDVSRASESISNADEDCWDGAGRIPEVLALAEALESDDSGDEEERRGPDKKRRRRRETRGGSSSALPVLLLGHLDLEVPRRSGFEASTIKGSTFTFGPRLAFTDESRRVSAVVCDPRHSHSDLLRQIIGVTSWTYNRHSGVLEIGQCFPLLASNASRPGTRPLSWPSCPAGGESTIAEFAEVCALSALKLSEGTNAASSTFMLIAKGKSSERSTIVVEQSSASEEISETGIVELYLRVKEIFLAKKSFAMTGLRPVMNYKGTCQEILSGSISQIHVESSQQSSLMEAPGNTPASHYVGKVTGTRGMGLCLELDGRLLVVMTHCPVTCIPGLRLHCTVVVTNLRFFWKGKDRSKPLYAAMADSQTMVTIVNFSPFSSDQIALPPLGCFLRDQCQLRSDGDSLKALLLIDALTAATTQGRHTESPCKCAQNAVVNFVFGQCEESFPKAREQEPDWSQSFILGIQEEESSNGEDMGNDSDSAPSRGYSAVVSAGNSMYFWHSSHLWRPYVHRRSPDHFAVSVKGLGGGKAKAKVFFPAAFAQEIREKCLDVRGEEPLTLVLKEYIVFLHSPPSSHHQGLGMDDGRFNGADLAFVYVTDFWLSLKSGPKHFMVGSGQANLGRGLLSRQRGNVLQKDSHCVERCGIIISKKVVRKRAIVSLTGRAGCSQNTWELRLGSYGNSSQPQLSTVRVESHHCKDYFVLGAIVKYKTKRPNSRVNSDSSTLLGYAFELVGVLRPAGPNGCLAHRHVLHRWLQSMSCVKAGFGALCPQLPPGRVTQAKARIASVDRIGVKFSSGRNIGGTQGIGELSLGLKIEDFTVRVKCEARGDAAWELLHFIQPKELVSSTCAHFERLAGEVASLSFNCHTRVVDTTPRHTGASSSVNPPKGNSHVNARTLMLMLKVSLALVQLDSLLFVCTKQEGNEESEPETLEVLSISKTVSLTECVRGAAALESL